jgi:peptide/nickel transport system ATP-binding protein
MVILDEPVSALDKSIEAQVLNLLRSLKRQFNLTYVFISHDLSVVRYISDRVLVMYLGRVVELGTVDAVFEQPQHPYTQALLASRPSMDPARRIEEPPITGTRQIRSTRRWAAATAAGSPGGVQTADPPSTSGGPQSPAHCCHILDPSSGPRESRQCLTRRPSKRRRSRCRWSR